MCCLWQTESFVAEHWHWTVSFALLKQNVQILKQRIAVLHCLGLIPDLDAGANRLLGPNTVEDRSLFALTDHCVWLLAARFVVGSRAFDIINTQV